MSRVRADKTYHARLLVIETRERERNSATPTRSIALRSLIAAKIIARRHFESVDQPPLIHVSPLFKGLRNILSLHTGRGRKKTRRGKSERRRGGIHERGRASRFACSSHAGEPISKADTRYSDQCHWPIWNTIRGENERPCLLHC